MAFKFENLFSGKDLEEFKALPSAGQEQLQAGLDTAAQEMIKPLGVVFVMADKILDIVLKSDLLLAVAKLQRRYYLALLDEGFSTDQAMALASAFASMLQGLKQK